MYAGIHYTLITQGLPKYLWCGKLFTLAIVRVVHYRSRWKYGTDFITKHVISISLLLLFFFTDFSHAFKTKIEIWGNLHCTYILYPHMTPQTHIFNHWKSIYFELLDHPILILFYCLTSTMMSPPTWNVGWLDHPIIGSYT